MFSLVIKEYEDGSLYTLIKQRFQDEFDHLETVQNLKQELDYYLAFNSAEDVKK